MNCGKTEITFHEVKSIHGLRPSDDVRVVPLGPCVGCQQVGGATVASNGDGARLEHGVDGIPLEPNCNHHHHHQKKKKKKKHYSTKMVMSF